MVIGKVRHSNNNNINVGRDFHGGLTAQKNSLRDMGCACVKVYRLCPFLSPMEFFFGKKVNIALGG